MAGNLYNHFIRAFSVVSSHRNWPVPKSQITDIAHRDIANNFIHALVVLILAPNPSLFQALKPNHPALNSHPLGETLARIIWQHGKAGQRQVEALKKSSCLPTDAIHLVYRDIVKRALFNNLLAIQQVAIKNNLPLSPFLTNEALTQDLAFLNQETRQLFNDLEKSSSSNAQVLYELSTLSTKYLIGLGVIIVAAIYFTYMTDYLKDFLDQINHPVSSIEYYISFILCLVLLPFLVLSIISPIYMLYRYSGEIALETIIFANTLTNWATGVSERKLKAELKTDKRLFLKLPFNVPEAVKNAVNELEAPAPNSAATQPRIF